MNAMNEYLSQLRAQYLPEGSAEFKDASLTRAEMEAAVGDEALKDYPLVKGENGEPDRLFICGLIVTEFERALFSDIAPDDVSGTQIAKLLSGYEGEHLELVLNTPGGVVTEGVLVYETLRGLRDKGVKVTALIAGMSASAGTMVQCAAEEIVASPLARLLVHPPHTAVRGDSEQMRYAAEQLEKLEEVMLAFYKDERDYDATKDLVARAGNERGTWLTAKEALKVGLIDSIRSAEEDPEEEEPAEDEARKDDKPPKMEAEDIGAGSPPRTPFDKRGGESTPEPTPSAVADAARLFLS